MLAICSKSQDMLIWMRVSDLISGEILVYPLLPKTHWWMDGGTHWSLRRLSPSAWINAKFSKCYWTLTLVPILDKEFSCLEIKYCHSETSVSRLRRGGISHEILLCEKNKHWLLGDFRKVEKNHGHNTDLQIRYLLIYVNWFFKLAFYLKHTVL